jgi:hypothetical protein
MHFPHITLLNLIIATIFGDLQEVGYEVVWMHLATVNEVVNFRIP